MEHMMNNRINELMIAATVATDERTPEGFYYKVDQQKFAEYIIRECAKFLEENSGYDDCNNAWHPEPEDLLEHFGVE